ncbi:unnamed protein product [Strongylus vulgaris]|uniref:Helicase ATP-binding domain-containing protein n=1 Tax=Strongylus vulgaris TaxID=40348 RepID=A0A3P7JEP6_STRVU|nr:unnamed protein product [Strongylus vulgaris]
MRLASGSIGLEFIDNSGSNCLAHSRPRERRVSNLSGPGAATFLPRIYYCSRTHSQLAQVVRELNRTIIRATVLGSRDQLCIHDRVCKESAICRGMVSKRTCYYYNNFDNAHLDQLSEIFTVESGVPDIEDMVAVGRKQGVCPFYRCRQMQETAELVLLPYNYIIDPQLRKIHRVDLSGSIVIFDEAHNLVIHCLSLLQQLVIADLGERL